MQVRTLLVPVDGSKGANDAAAFAARLALATGAEITLLYVFDNPSAACIGLHQLPQADFDRTIQNVAQGSFDAARTAIAEIGTPNVHTKVGLGDPAKEILGVATSGRFDMVVMGSRGLSPVKEILLGSVSETVTRKAPCPVTVVR